MTAELILDGIDRLTDGRLGTFDVACPCCGLYRQPVDEWCEKRRVSRFTFYKMLGVKLNKCRTISLEADEAWQREREAQTTTVSVS
jgi:hypothetical protein